MDSRVRHIAKAITWRIIASATTLGVAAYIQGAISGRELGLLAFLDITVKLSFYYLHERFWYNLNLNIKTKIRHIIKAFSWRFIAGSTTVILVVLIFNEEQGAYEKAGSIALIETVLKMIFYYGHEEVWYKINLGLDQREKNRMKS